MNDVEILQEELKILETVPTKLLEAYEKNKVDIQAISLPHNVYKTATIALQKEYEENNARIQDRIDHVKRLLQGAYTLIFSNITII